MNLFSSSTGTTDLLPDPILLIADPRAFERSASMAKFRLAIICTPRWKAMFRICRNPSRLVIGTATPQVAGFSGIPSRSTDSTRLDWPFVVTAPIVDEAPTAPLSWGASVNQATTNATKVP